MLQMIAVMLGVSLDGAVYMMQVGATLRQLTWKKRGIYGLIYAFVSLAAVLLSYCVAWTLKDDLNVRLQALVAGVIVLSLGVMLVTKSLHHHFEEKLDKTFGAKKMLRMAVLTNIDTLLLGTCFSFLGVSLPMSLLIVGIFACLTTVLALSIGYSLGAGYQRVICVTGGALMAILGIALLMGSI